MAISSYGRYSATRSSSHEAISDQEWLCHRLDCLNLFADSYRQRRKSYRTTVKSIDKGEKYGSIEAIKPLLIYLVDGQRLQGVIESELAGARYLS
jgi:hypothetical protein